MGLKEFRKANNLKQDELAQKIGVSRSFISQVESGHSKLPTNVLQTILNNPYGWDVSMLIEEGSIINNQNGTHIGGNNTVTMSGANCALEKENASLRKENELLRTQLEKIEAEKQEYWEVIKQLTIK